MEGLKSSGRSEDYRKKVTAVFADIVGSTALAERFDPETYRELLLAFLERMAAVVDRHGGVVEHIAGDGVLGVFGSEVAEGDDATRAVRAAGAMLDEIEALNDEVEPRLGVRMQMRVGVNTGTVVVGRRVAGHAVNVGDTMNVAARLQSYAPAGGMVIGAETHRLVSREVEVEPAGELELRGRQAPISAFRVLRMRPQRTAVPLSDRPLVGRGRERSLLTVAFERCVARGSPEFVTLLGDAGTGKSRLLTEVAHRYRGRATMLVGRCLSYGEGITYWAAAEIVRQAVGIDEKDHTDDARRKLAEAVQDLDDADAVASHLAQLTGLEPAAEPGEQALYSVRRLLEARASAGPVVVVFDDLQWAEPALLDLVEGLAAQLELPVLLACTARFELLSKRPDWKNICPTTIPLGPLPSRQVDDLVELVVGDALPPPTRERLVEIAAGNPLFVEQVLHLLVDDGRLRREGDRWVAGEIDALEVPPSIEATLASRVDHLAERERACAEAAAVIGMEFWTGAVDQLVPGGVNGAVTGLASKLVIEPVRRPGARGDMVRFRHLLLRDAVYAAIPKARRAELHERVAEWMLAWAEDRVGEVEEIVGYHFEAAARYRGELLGGAEEMQRLARRASEYLAAAGRRAANRDDEETARGFFARVEALEESQRA